MAQSGQQEEVIGKAYDLRLIQRLWQFVIPYKRMFFFTMLLLPVQQAFGLAQPYLMKIGSIGISPARISGACRMSCCCFSSP